MSTTFAKAITDLAKKDPNLFIAFLRSMHTPKEWAELELRFQIVERLARKEPQLKIAKELGVGIATVTRGSREMKDPKSGVRSYYSRSKR